MTDRDLERFEDQLRQLKPGKLPEELVARIHEAVSASPASSPRSIQRVNRWPRLFQLLRWVVPASAVVLVTAAIWRHQTSARQDLSGALSQNDGAPTLLKADSVEIGNELVSSFDAVATLPGGEPVRFRCQQWMNKVVVDDEKQGLLVESRMPHVVVVPVGFETY